MATAHKKVDWEKLCHQLQEALSKEMKEVERLEMEICDLNNDIERYKRIVDDYNGESLSMYSDGKNKNAIICYLERRLFEEMKKNDQLIEEKRHEELPF